MKCTFCFAACLYVKVNRGEPARQLRSMLSSIMVAHHGPQLSFFVRSCHCWRRSAKRVVVGVGVVVAVAVGWLKTAACQSFLLSLLSLPASTVSEAVPALFTCAPVFVALPVL